MVSDEKILAALMECGTATEAAARLNIAPKTIYRRLCNVEFKALYKSLQADFLRLTVRELADSRADAVEVIQEIMQDETVNPAIRLQCAQSILSFDIKYSAKLSEAEAAVSGLEMDKKINESAIEFQEKIEELHQNEMKRITERGVTHGIS